MKAKAYAKINLTLNVVGKREDGYHYLDSIMQSVNVFDTVEILLNDSETVTVKTNNQKVEEEENTAKIAAELYFSENGITDGAEIFINKKIPIAAGLGGGSADAAAVLKLLNGHYKKMDSESLKKLGEKVGADVPFCMTGGTAFVTGIGENIEKLPDLSECCILLCKNAKKSSTAMVYKTLDSFNLKKDNRNASAKKAVEDGDFFALCRNLFNDFSLVVKETGIETVLNVFDNTDALGFSLSGAGPTLFAVFSENEQAKEVMRMLKPSVEFIEIVTPVNCGVEKID